MKRMRRGVLAAVMSLLLVLAGSSAAAILPGASASAAPVYEITGVWAQGTPDTVAKGAVVTGVWRVNVNDDQAAPANDPVDNVTFTVTLQHGHFSAIPDACKGQADGVDPASAISDDGTTLSCNVGTHDEGTAVVVQAPMVADGATGDELGAIGEIDGHRAELPPIPTANPFGMDVAWGASTNSVTRNAASTDVDLEWTLFLNSGSDAGPDSVSYTLTIDAADGANIVPRPGADGSCTSFTNGSASGHPWSGGGKPDEQTAPFPASCTLTRIGTSDQYTLTLTGIDYSQTQVPTEDSTGRSLPTDRVAVASGSIWLRIAGTQNDSISLTSNAPNYTAPSGGTASDDPSNNTTSKTWTQGSWSNEYRPAQSGSDLGFWSGQYRVSPGTVVTATTSTTFGQTNYPADDTFAQCVVLDTAYETFVNYDFTYNYATAPEPNTAIPGSTVEYYVGGSALVTPGSAGYDPNSFHCDGTAGWTTTPPADPSAVKAVRASYPFSAIAGANNSVLDVRARVDDDAPVGQDIWEFGEVAHNGVWQTANRSTDPDDRNNGPATPDDRYPFIGTGRDVLYVIGVSPAVSKSVDHTTLTPGDPATFTLNYSANGTGAIPPTVDAYQLVDVLPEGLNYVTGSADPAPQVSPDGRTLTWTLDGVPTNSPQTLSYQAVADGSATPGSILTNDVTAAVDGQTTAPATASVVVPTDGYTTIAKTADEQYIPNTDGSGDGSGSWTVTLRSADPLPQDFTDTIDILPYNGDGRGTAYSGRYTLQPVTAAAGATVYYTTADPGALSDDPGDPSNGSAGSTAGNTVGWSTGFTPNATAVRVIGPALASGAEQQFHVPITTDGAHGGDVLVNRAQARDGHTQLVMRTSAPITVANSYDATLKKYVQDVDGVWHDANDAADFPVFHYGDTVHYRVVVTNVGQGTLTGIDVTDDKQPELGAFHVDTLAPGQSQEHEYAIVVGEDVTDSVVNTACATAAQPADATAPPVIPCDPAGFDVTNYVTTKTSDPASDAAVQPGQVIHYTITVTQQGSAPAAASFSDDLSKVLDDADYDGDVHASLGTAQLRGSTLSWSGTVPVGGTATVTYSVTVHDVAGLTASGDAELINTVTSPGCAPHSPKCTTIHRAGWYDYSKVADPKSGTTVAVGDTVRYTVVVVQHGRAAIPHAIARDDMSDVLDDASYDDDATADSGALSFRAPTLSWRGDLGVGQKVTIDYSVTVTGAGDRHLTNAVMAPDPRGVCDESIGCATHHDIDPVAVMVAQPGAPALPHTGTDTWPPLILAGSLLGGGFGVSLAVWLRRRRRAHA